MTAAIVLAGGASSRFGRDKLAADLDGRPLLHHVLEAAAAVADEVIVVIGPDVAAPEVPSRPGSTSIVVRDEQPHGGPLAGLGTGLRTLSGRDDVIVLAGDMPAVVPAVLRLLLDALQSGSGTTVARLESGRVQPLPMAVRADLATSAVEALLERGEHSLRALFDEVDTAVVPAATWRALDPAGRTLVDVDTPDDLRRFTVP